MEVEKIEGEWDAGDGETYKVHLNVAVNIYLDGKWIDFRECSLDEFREVIEATNARKV